MPRLSITLTESQAAALEDIAAETGATKQSMIGLAISAWIRDYELTNIRPRREDDFEPTPTYCEVCGERAEWASFMEDGKEHYFCDRHGASDLRVS